MKIFIKNHPFHYEIENIARLFFPYEKLVIKKSSEIVEVFDSELLNAVPPFIITGIDCEKSGKEIFVKTVFADGDSIFNKELRETIQNDSKENERIICSLLFKLLTEYTGITMPWGMITGVRPVKYYRTLLKEKGITFANEYFKNSYFVTENKISLAETTEKYEKKILDSSKDNSFSLYISIPFCPSRCSYCSFVSQSVEKAKHLVDPYISCLCREIELTGEIAKKYNLNLETVYIGGGTPTTLSPVQLQKLLNAVNTSFDMYKCREFTVEAGRPDTITEEKLFTLRNNGVTRISINPQTLNDDILKKIGRKHTASETLNAFSLAEKCNFKTVNSDLIAGLPFETVESFSRSLDKIIELGVENITVHTLSIKRSARLTEQGLTTDRDDAVRTGKMLEYAERTLTEKGYIPYYLYRQSRMVGNFENVGWSLPGMEGLYNVFIMDETHTILACGAGAVTKLKNPYFGNLERIFNYKFPYEYIDDFSEMLSRKKRVSEFFDSLYGV